MSDGGLFDLRMADGSRHFASFREGFGTVADWDVLRAAIGGLCSAVETGFVTDHVTEAWLDFTYGGHEFSLNNQGGEWWCFVRDPAAPEEVLRTVAAHFAAALRSA